MPVHIQQRRCEQFAHVVAFIKLRRAEHAVAQRGRHDFPGLMMPRIVGKDLRLAGPMFINLRRKLNKIARRIGSRQAGILLAGKQAVQGMPKFVK